MPDIGITWDPVLYRGDWTVTSGDLSIDPGGLRTAVLLSLFTDRVAVPGYVAPAGSPQGRRGWWGDTYDGTLLGSLLWTLNRSVKSDGAALLLQAQDMCLDALEWLVTAGVVASITVTTRWLTATAIEIQIIITQPQAPPATFDFSWSWLGTAGLPSPNTWVPTPTIPPTPPVTLSLQFNSPQNSQYLPVI